jgi:protein-glutamine gamma-glutamyltransferase
MRLGTVFHFSFYFTLALASACLTLPTTFFLGWMPYFFVGMVALFALAWRREGVWVLSETAANHLGVFIALGAVGWILWQMPRSENDLVTSGVNWPAGLLPHLGPLLMILLAVKLFRPKKLPDWWVLQTMGLMMVTLAAILADDQWFAPLLALYLASFLWCMALYYPVRERALAQSPTHAAATPLFPAMPTSTPLPWRWGGLPRVAGWAAAVGAASFGLFLIAPRQGQSQWNARQLSAMSPTTTKIGIEPGIDLNLTGTVELSDDPAFSVTVRDRAGRLQDPSNIRRWRQEVLEIYGAGRWHTLSQALELLYGDVSEPAPKPRESAPPALAPDQWLVEFHVKPREAGGLVLAEPVDLSLGVGLDSRMEDKPYAGSFFSPDPGRDSFWTDVQGKGRTHNYGQVIRISVDDRWQPAPLVSAKYCKTLADQRAPFDLVPWTRELLNRLPASQGAVQAFIQQRSVLPDHLHEQVAQELCQYLAESGEYRYSLELRRHEHRRDPTVDFLMNVKEGHCERFAGGLALMLRAVGIRCRVVRGYLGVETDEHGEGIVRKSRAHSWVQALVPGAEPDTWQWLTLDPTPASGETDGALEGWLRWCVDNLFDLRSAWKRLIMEYTPEQQATVLDRALHALLSKQGILTLATIGMAVLTVRAGKRVGRRWYGRARFWKTTPADARPTPMPFFAALVRLLERHGIGRPAPGQTPREYAAAATAALRNRPATRDLASAPEHLVVCLYRVRFGGQELSQTEQVEINHLLQSLRTQLSI